MLQDVLGEKTLSEGIVSGGAYGTIRKRRVCVNCVFIEKCVWQNKLVVSAKKTR